ncbi:MAG: hypothetical protein GX893_04495 [Firmicutes bacterium]|nr:hypothetical protein [Bacillota bacterium]
MSRNTEQVATPTASEEENKVFQNTVKIKGNTKNIEQTNKQKSAENKTTEQKVGNLERLFNIYQKRK